LVDAGAFKAPNAVDNNNNDDDDDDDDDD